jgi:aryl-alcohol dehydrogenase-like predicted oxidoreductase
LAPTRWRRGRGIGDEIVIATKVGARPLAPGTSFTDNAEGLSARVIRESAERSLDRLGVSRLDVLYAHIEDPAVPLEETVEGFAALVAEGTVGLLGVSNHWAWRVERACGLAAAGGLPGYEVLEDQHSYLRPRTDLPGVLSPDGAQEVVGGDLLSYPAGRAGAVDGGVLAAVEGRLRQPGPGGRFRVDRAT